MKGASPRRRDGRPAFLRARRRMLLAGVATAAAAILAGHPEPASSQAFQGNPGVIKGTVNRMITSPTTETLMIGSETALITWFPNSDLNPFPFLPAGNVATFTNDAAVTDFVVLNRIGTGQAIRFDGTVISQLQTAMGDVPGGTLLFASPGGIIVGGTALFDVGNLVLTTLTVATLDEAGAGPYLVPRDFQFSQSDVPPAAIVTEAGARFTATSENSYIAMVAPLVSHGGTTDVNGSAGYVAGEQVELTVNDGLFDIVVATGTDTPDALVHAGETGGPASTGGVDNHRIYMVAVPKNQAITALLGGDVGFDPAVSAAIENGAIVLSAGFDVAGDLVDRASGAGPAASFHIEDADVTSDLFGYAVGDMFAGGGAGPLTFGQDVSLFADGRARLFAAPGQAVDVLGAALVSAARSQTSDPAVGDLTGGEARASAGSGGTLTIAGNLVVDASGAGLAAAGGAPAGDGTGGTARLVADGGTVQVGGDATVTAHGSGGANVNLSSGDGAGGDAETASSGGGSIAVGGNLRVAADGRGGSVAMATETAGAGTGGRAGVTTDGGSITVAGGADLSARGAGGQLILPGAALDGAPGTGGAVAVAAGGGGPLTVAGPASLDARGQGGAGAIGGNGGDGEGGSATLAAESAQADIGQTQVQAGGFGGAGGAGGGLPDSPGGTGGEGRGGAVGVTAGPAGALTIDDLRADARGQGGSGGIGGTHDNDAGSGGSGGDGLGGGIGVGSDGGDLLVTAPGGLMLTAPGLGGAGGAGGESAGPSGSGGAGGTGGDAVGGNAQLAAAGGSIDGGPALVSADATGGAGGAGGNAGSDGGSGGTGGGATGGGARLLASGGTLNVGDATVTANAGGGAGGIGGDGGSTNGAGGDGGDAAGGVEAPDLARGALVSAEGGDLILASALVQATGTGGSGGAGIAGGDGGDGSGGASGFGSLAGLVQAGGPVVLAADGIGGDGGDAVQVAAAGGDGGDGGAGSGGRALLSAQVSPAAAVDLQGVDLTAGGTGGGGGAGAFGASSGGAGGDGGAGAGGDARILADRGTLDGGNARLTANGGGGAGGSGGDSGAASGQGGAGGDGAAGSGGSALVGVSGGAATLADLELTASGAGGTGGAGGAAAAPGAAGAEAGSLGGLAQIDASRAAAGDPAGSLTAAAASLRVEGDGGGRISLSTRLDPAAFDSLDVFGRGIALASVSAEDSLLRVNGPAVFDIGGDLFLFTLGSGRIEVGGLLQVTATGSIVNGTRPDDEPASSDIAAGSFAAAAGADYLGAGSTLDVDGDITIAAAGVVEAGTLDAGGAIDIDGGSIDLADGTAGGDIDLAATGDIVVGTAAAGADFLASAGGSIDLADGTAGGDIDLAATGDIVVGTAAAGDDFLASAGGSFTGTSVTANVGSDILIDAVGDLRLENGEASGLIRLTSSGASVLSAGRLQAGTSLEATAAADIGINEAAGDGAVSLTADGDIAAADAASGGSIAAAAGGRLDAGELQAEQDIVLDAGEAIAVATVAAGRDIDIAGQSIDLADGTAGRDLTLAAGGAIDVDRAEAGDDFRATAGADFVADNVFATGLGPDSENGVGALAASGNVSVAAAGDLRLDDGAAAAAIALTSSAGNLLSDGLLSAGTTLLAAARLDLDIGDAAAAGAINLAADGDIGAGDLTAGDTLFAGARGDVTVATADSDRSITLEAGGALTAGTLRAADFIGIQAGGAADVGTADSAGFIAVAAAGPADLGLLTSGQDIIVEASDIALQSATAARDLTLAADGGIAAAFVEAGDELRATAGGDLDIDSLAAAGPVSASSGGDMTIAEATSGASIGLASGGDLRLDDGSAEERIALASGGSILSAGTLTAAGLDVDVGADLGLNDVVVAGDLDLAAPNGGIAGNLFDSRGRIDLEASGAVVLASARAAAGLAIAGASIDLAAAAAGGDIGLDSGGALIVGSASAGGDFSAAAAGDGTFGNVAADAATIETQGAAAFNGAVLAETVAIGSADIDLSATGSLGGAGTRLVLLAPLAGGPQTWLGGSADGPGFSLSDAEAGRITADILRLQVPAAADDGPDLLVRDLALDGARVGLLDILVGGVARVEGALRFAGAGPDNEIAIAADGRVEIVAPLGGIRLLDAGGVPVGRLTIRADDVWAGSAPLLDRLAADPGFAGRDVQLRTNGGPFAPRGHAEAGAIAVFAGDSFFVQNSGRPADLAGFTVTGTLTVTPTGAAPLSVYAFGRRIDPAGGFVTNSLFFGEVRFEPGTAGYVDPAQFNLCFINSGLCNAPDAPLPDGSDPTRGPFDVPGPAEIRDDLIDASFAADPLIDEPVTSGSDTILWVCDEDGDRDCPRDPRDD